MRCTLTRGLTLQEESTGDRFELSGGSTIETTSGFEQDGIILLEVIHSCDQKTYLGSVPYSDVIPSI